MIHSVTLHAGEQARRSSRPAAHGTVSAVGNLVMSGTATASDAGGPALDFASAVTGGGKLRVNRGAGIRQLRRERRHPDESGTAELQLDAPDVSPPWIVGFNGSASDAAHSDVIDLAGIGATSTGSTRPTRVGCSR